jgi:2'-5' RNA ligase
MAQALEVFFDARADAAVRDLWQRLAAAGLPGPVAPGRCRPRPHVSLTVADHLDPGRLAVLRLVLAERRPDLHLTTLGTFPGGDGVLFLGATPTPDLLGFHTRVHQALAGQSARHSPYYLPGRWVPHCTLARGLEPAQTATALRLLHDFQPITATLMGAGLIDTETGTVTPLAD